MYKTHILRDFTGRVCCPKLRGYACPVKKLILSLSANLKLSNGLILFSLGQICGATGDFGTSSSHI